MHVSIYIYLYIKRNHIRHFTSNTIIQIKLIYIRDLYVLWACGYQSIAPVRSKRRWKSSWIPWSKSQERLDNSYGRSAKAIPRANKCKSPALILWCILWCAMFIHGWCFDVICNIYIYLYASANHVCMYTWSWVCSAWGWKRLWRIRSRNWMPSMIFAMKWWPTEKSVGSRKSY